MRLQTWQVHCHCRGGGRGGAVDFCAVGVLREHRVWNASGLRGLRGGEKGGSGIESRDGAKGRVRCCIVGCPILESIDDGGVSE